MPTILRENGYRFYWYSNEGVYKRIHIHVERAGSKAKFWLHPLELAENKRFIERELNEIKQIISNNTELIENEWNSRTQDGQ